MTLREKLQIAWKNKEAITEGFYNAWISSSKEIKDETERRLDICRLNICGYYDEKGESEKAVYKGKETCGGCGCCLSGCPSTKVACMSCHCYLGDIGKEPLWTALITADQEKEINQKQYDNQFKNQQNSKNAE